MAEKHFEAKVVQAIKDLGGEVDEFSQRRRSACPRCGQAVYAGTQQTPGIPDLRAVFPSKGVSIWIEVKWKRNKPTPHQRAWMLREIQLGTLAAPIWTIDDLVWLLAWAGIQVVNGPQRDDISQGTLEYTDVWRERVIGDRA